MQSLNEKNVFISYADEDSDFSEKLYNDLKQAGLQPVRGSDIALPGRDWKVAIQKGIKNSRYFIPLFSSKSIQKRGNIQKEFKYALDLFEEFPEGDIFVIPTRLDNCEIPFERLQNIVKVDLFPNWSAGIKMILKGLGMDPEEVSKPLEEKEDEWKMGLSEQDWEVLLKFIQQKVCIPVIGQGVNKKEEAGKPSISIFQSYINSWIDEFKFPLKDLYDIAKVYSLEDSSQLARLAQFLAMEQSNEKYPKELLSELISKLSPPQFKKKSPFHILASLDLSIYLTTNYDTLMEDTIEEDRTKKPEKDFCKWSELLINEVNIRKVSSVFDDEHYEPSKTRPIVFHVTGVVTFPSSMVLTERDYFQYVAHLNKFEDKHSCPSVLKTAINNSSLLFIGYDLQDINFRAIVHGFLASTSSIGYGKPSFAVQSPPNILNKEQVKLQKYLEKYSRHLFELRVYWGTTQDFLSELYERKKEFDSKTGRYSYLDEDSDV